MTVINISKEAIVEQHLDNGFSIVVLDDGGIFIKPVKENKSRKYWAEQISNDIKKNGLPGVSFNDDLNEIKDWTW